MTKNHYERFEKSQLILRDELAIDRTLLANERTLLAYLRSAVALFITGASIIHFSVEGWFLLVGFTCVPGALLVCLIGLIRFERMNKAILIVRNQVKKINNEQEKSLDC